MSALDAKVSNILDQTSNADQDDEDALIESLENDDALDMLREKRREQLHQEISRARQMRNMDHGEFQELQDEKALMDITTSTRFCVVHFFKSDFKRCRIMNSHLDTLAKMHLDTRFLRIEVEYCPFLVEKLQIQVLPCVISFKAGICVNRITGFEGLGRGTDAFSTADLERHLFNAEVLERLKMDESYSSKSDPLRAESISEIDDNDDDDWD